ncbi:MAG: carbohydrate-binding protein [Prevotella sp.]|nr:carbohydrate-binding protein [Prevotella sp.]
MKRNIISLLLSLTATVGMSAAVESGNVYKIALSDGTGKSLMVSNSTFGNGIDVVVWTETDVPSQQWEAVATDDGGFQLKNVYTGTCIGRAGVLKENIAARTLGAGSVSRTTWNIVQAEGSTTDYLIYMPADTANFYLSAKATTDGSTTMLSTTPYTWTLIPTTPKTTFTRAMQAEMADGWLTKFLNMRTETTATMGNGGGWGDAEMMETLLDAYETTGNRTYIDTFKYLYDYFARYVGTTWNKLVYTDDYKWYGHEFNDDVMWMVLAVSRAGMLTGTKRYTRIAKNNFDIIYNRAIQQWGTMRWKESDDTKNGSNSCINCPTIIAACYIAMATGDESYYEKARSLYDKQSEILFNASTGQVYDSGSWDTSTGKFTIGNYWVSTYNQGTMLGAAVLLYDHYKTEKYKKHADLIMNRTVSELCNTYGIVKACQEVEGDRCGFKGILMRYVRRYVTDLAKSQRHEWLLKNAMHAYSNSNSKHYAHSAWLTKSAENGLFENKTRYDNQPFGCSTAVSAAVNYPMHQTIRSAYQPIEAEEFDRHQGMSVDRDEAFLSQSGTGVTCYSYQAITGDHAEYCNIDFGTDIARSITINILPSPIEGKEGKIEIHTDSIDGQLIATLDIASPTTGEEQETTYSQIKADITPTSGQKNIFLVFISPTGDKLSFAVDSFTFSTSPATLPYDLNGDGKVSTADIQIIINEMKRPQEEQNPAYDLNADGKISTADIQIIINEMKK